LNRRRILLAVAMAMLLAGCGRSAATTPTASMAGAFNDADVRFLQGMIPHHQQAVDMAELADGRTRRPELARLAQAIIASHGVEIRTMQAWLRHWDRPMPALTSTGHGGAHVPGMLGQGQLEWLKTLQRGAFDIGFLTMMRTHHQGALEMAQVELHEGSSPDIKALAQRIIDQQQAEIRRMLAWKQAWA
jgi:uncharacterized protein (DUF305 family)